MGRTPLAPERFELVTHVAAQTRIADRADPAARAADRERAGGQIELRKPPEPPALPAGDVEAVDEGLLRGRHEERAPISVPIEAAEEVRRELMEGEGSDGCPDSARMRGRRDVDDLRDLLDQTVQPQSGEERHVRRVAPREKGNECIGGEAGVGRHAPDPPCRSNDASFFGEPG